MSARMTMANMAIECGAKAGIFEADQIMADYYQIPLENIKWLKADEGTRYAKCLKYQAEEFEVVAAYPDGVDCIQPIGALEGRIV